MQVWSPNNKKGDVSMASDVCKSNMAAKVATTDMEFSKITKLNSLIH